MIPSDNNGSERENTQAKNQTKELMYISFRLRSRRLS